MTKLKQIKAKIIIETNRNYLEKLAIHSNLNWEDFTRKLFFAWPQFFPSRMCFGYTSVDKKRNILLNSFDNMSDTKTKKF